MKNVIIFGILLSVFALGVSCKRTLKDAEFFGTPYKAASKQFAIKSYSQTVPSKKYGFQNAPVTNPPPNRRDREFFINAKFNEVVSWKCSIRGRLSGAEKIYENTTDTINRNLVYWRGGSSNIYFFRAGEICDIELSFLGSDSILKDTLTLFSVRPVDGTYNGINQFLVDDFDGGTLTPFGNAYADRADGDVFDYNTTYPFVKVQKDQSYWWKSKDNNNNTYCGGADTDPVTTSLLGKVFVKDPDSLYLNCYVYGAGKQGTALSILVYEQDQTVGDYKVDQFNDRWIFTFPITWSGWKLVSIKYSDFKKPGSFGCLGNCVKEPKKLKGVALSFDSYPDAGKEVEGAIDFFIVTQGGAFNPSFQ